MTEEVEEISDRLSILETDNRLSIVILSVRNGFRPLLRKVWAFLWILVGAYVIREYLIGGYSRQQNMILMIFLFFWIYYLFRIMRAIVWDTNGKEMLLLEEEDFRLKNSFGKYGRALVYPSSNISLMNQREPSKGLSALFEDSFWSIGTGALILEVHGKKLLFGMGLDQREQDIVMSRFNKKLKQISAPS